MRVVVVTRDVAEDEEHNYLGRAVHKGERFYTFHEPTYGAVDDLNGIALSQAAGQYPFFEFPRDAVEAAPPSELRAVWPTDDGFGMACGCGGPHMLVTVLSEDQRGPGDKHISTVSTREFALTCDTCGTAHWITVTPDGPKGGKS